MKGEFFIMRKIVSVLAPVLVLCLLAACGTEDVLSDMTGGRSGAALDSSETDAADPVLPGEEIENDSPTDARPAPAGEDYSALSADECVVDDLPDPRVLPRITLDCPGADAINQAIREEFYPISEDPMWELHYEYAKGAGRVLSVVMVKRANDWMERTPYNLDMATGEELTGAELLDLLGVDRDELAQLEQAVLGEEFTHQFGDMKAQTDQAFYDGQYAKTTSPDNAELEKLWFSGDGQLCFAGRVYGLAGAEYYEYPLSTGLVF